MVYNFKDKPWHLCK